MITCKLSITLHYIFRILYYCYYTNYCSSPIIFCCTAIVCQTLPDLSQFLCVPGANTSRLVYMQIGEGKIASLSPTLKGNSAVWDSTLGLYHCSKMGKIISNYLCITSIVPNFGHLIPQPSHKLLCKTEKLLYDMRCGKLHSLQKYSHAQHKHNVNTDASSLTTLTTVPKKELSLTDFGY